MAVKKNSRTRVVVIGSGNIAWHIISHISFFKRFSILAYSHRPGPHLKQLEKEFKIDVTTDWEKVPANADIYFICTGDQAIQPVAARLKKLKVKGIVLHTSGTVPLSAISKSSKNTGVFYPLQTFTFGKSVNWAEVPIFIEASNAKTLDALQRLALLYSKTVVQISSKQRIKLHLAAVIAGNFSNAMYAMAWLFLDRELDTTFFNYLHPLMLQTARKTKSMPPQKAQTGPAVRQDKLTQKKHLALLKNYPELKKLYKSMSKLIVKQQKPHAEL